MYADDIVCYLGDPISSIKELAILLNIFGLVMLVAALHWWKFQSDSNILALEQAENEYLLLDRLEVTKNGIMAAWD